MNINPTIEIRRISPHGLDAILLVLTKEYEDALNGIKHLPRDEVADQLNKAKAMNESIYVIEQFMTGMAHHNAQVKQMTADGA